jgi:hypothetical protein
VRAALRGLDPRNADRVGRHLVAAGTLVDDDPAEALSHARAARDRASRVAAVREAVGVAAYHAGDYAEAARELRAYRRMSGDRGYRAVLADCERALGRPEVALRLVAEALAEAPDPDELVELRMVEAGARSDLGELATARLVLEDALGGRPDPAQLSSDDPGRLRLAAAYADLLEAEGDEAGAAVWSAAVAALDLEDVTGRGAGEDVVFSEEPLDLDARPSASDVAEPSDVAGPSDAAEPSAVAEPSAEVDPGDEGQLGEEAELDLSEDIEAEVAELLGEDHPLAQPPDDASRH